MKTLRSYFSHNEFASFDEASWTFTYNVNTDLPKNVIDKANTLGIKIKDIKNFIYNP